MLTASLSVLGAMVLRLLRGTWRIRTLGHLPLPTDRPIVFCFWHGEQAGLFGFAHERKVAVLSSLSRDGRIQAGILRRLGFLVRDGSSSHRGAGGLKGIVDAVRTGADAAFAVDGPKGPRGVSRPGAIIAARQCDGVLVPMRVHAAWAKVFKRAWDRYRLPLPFSLVTIEVGAPLSPVGLSTDALDRALGHPETTAGHGRGL